MSDISLKGSLSTEEIEDKKMKICDVLMNRHIKNAK